jgi:hypothetical protein
MIKIRSCDLGGVFLRFHSTKINSADGGVGYAVPTAVNRGSELLIFVPLAAQSITRGS